MKFVLAPDSFKGSLSAKAVCSAMEEGIKCGWHEAEVISVPMADGGEGTVETLVDAQGGSFHTESVHGPLYSTVNATYGRLDAGKTAVIEMAEASGLGLVSEEDRDALKATTYGVGELMKSALDNGAKKLIIGVGGSATTDGGSGMAQALGVKFYDTNHNELPLGGGALAQLAQIDMSGLDPRLAGVEVVMASDVTNPLVGENGASAVFGEQKGANLAEREQLDRALTHYGELLKTQLGRDVMNRSGAGAGGGIGAALMAFCNAKQQAGVDLVIQMTQLEEHISSADVVLTGEGRVDSQTAYGKVPQGVAKVAKKYGKPVIVIAGSTKGDLTPLYQVGMDAVFTTIPTVAPLAETLAQAYDNVAQTSENIARLLKTLATQ